MEYFQHYPLSPYMWDIMLFNSLRCLLLFPQIPGSFSQSQCSQKAWRCDHTHYPSGSLAQISSSK